MTKRWVAGSDHGPKRHASRTCAAPGALIEKAGGRLCTPAFTPGYTSTTTVPLALGRRPNDGADRSATRTRDRMSQRSPPTKGLSCPLRRRHADVRPLTAPQRASLHYSHMGTLLFVLKQDDTRVGNNLQRFVIGVQFAIYLEIKSSNFSLELRGFLTNPIRSGLRGAHTVESGKLVRRRSGRRRY